MKTRTTWFALPCLCLLGAAAAPTARAQAPSHASAPASGSTTAAGAVAQIRFNQAPPHQGQASTIGFALALTPDRTDEATMTVGTTIYQVKVGWMTHGPGAPLLEVQFEKRAPHQSPTRMDVTAHVPRGVRTVLGSIDRPDGSRATLDVTLR